ncbi:MAG: type I-B CRISPR-associated protein Cas7/Csh2 [Promethearchaeota archaeon]
MTENKKNLKNRIEIIFIYDVRDANPNGDPDNSNMPRIDELTGENLVTDVRLKRTIRDYWLSKNIDILVKAVENPDGTRQSMEERVMQELEITKDDLSKKEQGKLRHKIARELPEKFIDIRAFGAAVTMTNANTMITGPVQFGLGRSLNLPTLSSKTITTTLASKSDKGMGSIGEYHTVDYSIIKFHGITNESTARETLFSEDDLKLLYEAIWLGTKQLNTRSKFNHVPRLLIAVKSKENKAQIGDLDLYVKLSGDRNVHSFENIEIDITEFIERLLNNKHLIETIEYISDPELQLTCKGNKTKNLSSIIEDTLPVNFITFDGE